MRLKDVLGEIQTDSANLFHGRLLRVLFNTSLWHIDAVGGRPPHHPLTNTATTSLEQAAFRRVLAVWEREPIVVDFGALAG